jgi:hypothetical protein
MRSVLALAYGSLCVLLPTPRRCIAPNRPRTTYARANVLLFPTIRASTLTPTADFGSISDAEGVIVPHFDEAWVPNRAICATRSRKRISLGVLGGEWTAAWQ